MFWNKKTKERRDLKIGALVAYLAMITVNCLANILPIGGNNTAQVSDSYPNLFAPIGFTFAIWGIIYVALCAYVTYQFAVVRGKGSKLTEETFDKVNRWFIASSLINFAWIFAWQYRQIGLSAILIVALLISLIKIVELLRSVRMSGGDQLAVRLPFSIYFGWITVATIANITTWLVSIGWQGGGIPGWIWMIVILTVGALIGSIGALRNNDIPYLLVFVWAFFGILMKHVVVFGSQYQSVITSLVLLIGGCAAVVTYLAMTNRSFYRNRDLA